MSESNYTFSIMEGTLCIVDEGPHDVYKTVTNNAENVLKEIKRIFEYQGEPFPNIVIYKDSEERWDGMKFDNEGRLEFYPLGKSSMEGAVREATKRFLE